jgi:hypothetical protein
MAVASDFDSWVEGKVYYCEWAYSDLKDKFKSGEFYPVAEVDTYYEAKGEERDEDCFKTYDEFCENEYLEISEYSYTTPGGEVVRACAKYGYDG